MENLFLFFVLILFLGAVWLKSLPGRRRTGRGYIQVEHHGRFSYEHRLVAERVLGRRLEDYEVVHHINGRRDDNRPQNLCVMHETDHESYHAWYNWIRQTYNVFPRRETQLRKLREDFEGILLSDLGARA